MRKDLGDYFITRFELGRGTVGVVRKAIMKSNGEALACKILGIPS